MQSGISSSSPFTITPVRSQEDLQAAISLFRAYAISLGIDLSFQDFDTEISSMPGKYAAPAGEILLAYDTNSTPIGCVALRPLSPPESCEMKRLYVLPQGRGLGLGRALIKALLTVATERGYKEIRLDTLKSMTAAQKLYEKEGFQKSQAYYNTPIEDTVFMSRRLSVTNA